MAISAIPKNNTRNCNKEFGVRWRACTFIQASQGGREVHKPRRYLTWKIPPPHPCSCHTRHFIQGPLSAHILYFPVYAFCNTLPIFYFLCLLVVFLTVYTHTKVWATYSVELGFAHRYSPEVEDSTWYIAGAQKILSVGKVSQKEETANAKCPEARMYEDQESQCGWCIVGRGRTAGSKTRKCVHVGRKGQKQGDN